ncbi:hypothetical protein D3C72_1440930 [compost metagenome]
MVLLSANMVRSGRIRMAAADFFSSMISSDSTMTVDALAKASDAPVGMASTRGSVTCMVPSSQEGAMPSFSIFQKMPLPFGMASASAFSLASFAGSVFSKPAMRFVPPQTVSVAASASEIEITTAIRLAASSRWMSAISQRAISAALAAR